MARVKKGRWTPEEDAFIADIPKDSKTGTRISTAIKQLQKAFKIMYGYKQVYSRWDYLQRTANKKEQTHPKKTNKKSDVDAMPLEFVEGPIENVRIDPREILSLQKGIDQLVPKLRILEGAFNIKTRLVKHTRQYVEKHYPRMVFGYTALPKTKQTKVYRKS